MAGKKSSLRKSLVHLLGALNTVAGTQYQLVKDYTSSGVAGFYESFHFFNSSDPTGGYVQYLDRYDAVSSALVGFTAPSVQSAVEQHAIYMGVDHAGTATVGRRSVRIRSKESFNPGSLFVADIAHMPSGCGVWPALWLLGGNASTTWPNAGEVDIIEQVNLAKANSVTLHTTDGCALDSKDASKYTGALQTPDCNVYSTTQSDNAGCSIAAPISPATFGEPFNEAGGGIYVTEWLQNTASSDATPNGGFAVWFFPRNNTPPALQPHLQTQHHEHIAGHKAAHSHHRNKPRAHGNRDGQVHSLDTATFGTPIARFSGMACDWASHFYNMHLVINIALCGDWAGKDWARSCAGVTGVPDCNEYVAQHPEAFTKAYWEILGLRVYRAVG